MILDKKTANEYFEYKNGKLFWKKVNHNKIAIGSEVGSLRKDNYRVVDFYYKKYKTHQIVFLMFNGYIPTKPYEIDHIDGNKQNNKIENLREVMHYQNSQNRTKQINNKSSSTGVYYHKKNKKWIVQCNYQNKRKYIGSFDDFELADLVAIEARNKLHGKFANNRANNRAIDRAMT